MIAPPTILTEVFAILLLKQSIKSRIRPRVPHWTLPSTPWVITVKSGEVVSG